MDALWPELDSTAAASQLYKAIHNIRKAFAVHATAADEWIEITEDVVRLVPPGGVVTDVLLFEQAARGGLRDFSVPDLETAVSTYSGDLLPTDFYAEWTSLPREHYRQLYLDVLITLSGQYERQGEFSEAAEMLRLALEKDPALESAHRGLMRIFARQGQATRALRQYERCREALQEELDVEPSPETDEMLADVRKGRWAREEVPAALRLTSPSPTPPIINRAAECARIDTALDRLAAGDGGAREREGNMAYGPFIEIFEAALRENPQMERMLPVEIGRMVPSFTGEGAPVPHSDDYSFRHTLVREAIYESISEARRRHRTTPSPKVRRKSSSPP